MAVAALPVPIAEFTKAVVAICVVLVPAGAVGAVGVPVKAGELIFAFRSKSASRLIKF